MCVLNVCTDLAGVGAGIKGPPETGAQVPRPSLPACQPPGPAPDSPSLSLTPSTPLASGLAARETQGQIPA